MRNITTQDTGLRIKVIQEKLGYMNTMKEQSTTALNLLKTNLPEARAKAFPTDKTPTTQEAKDTFKEYLDGIKQLSQSIRDIEAMENSANKEISAFNYLTYNIEEAKKYKNGSYKVLLLDLNGVCADGVMIAAISSDETETIMIGETSMDNLQANIDNADKVVTFAREDAIERLNELGITVTKEDRKFTSIHHLMRGYTDFQREGLETYAEIVDYTLENEDEYSNVYNLMRVYMGIVDIETLEVRAEQSDVAVDALLSQIQSVKPMLDEITGMVTNMQLSQMARMHDFFEDNDMVDFTKLHGDKASDFSEELLNTIQKMTKKEEV